MKKDLISIIVPIYKVEKYLRQCIDSIINQTYSNLEIILVDDGSPDNCGKICDEYVKIDKRIKVIHKENGGLSSARNAGLDIATGDYIGFVDSDDYIDKNMYEELINSINKYNSDIAVCTFSFKNKYRNKVVNYFNEEYLFKDKDKFIEAKDGKRRINPNAWTKLYKRKIFDNIRYPEGLIYEDSYVIYDIMNIADSVSYVPKPLYYYRERKNSVSKDKSGKCLDQVIALSKNIELLTKLGHYDIADFEKYRKVFALLKICNKLGHNSISNINYKSNKEEILLLCNELKDSKYLSNNQMNEINKILYDIDGYYKKLIFKIKISESLKRLLYYK